MLRFGDLPAAIHWIDLPGIARYGMEFALYAPDRRLRLTFPSPFLRNQPADARDRERYRRHGPLLAHRGDTGFESGFKNELAAFHDSIVTGRPPPTSGRDGLRDMLCARLSSIVIIGRHRSTIQAEGQG